jgi:superfamily II DNA or RNA helicase
MKEKTTLIKNGYLLNKKYLSESEQLKLKNDLTVAPVLLGDYGGKTEPEYFEVFREDKKTILVPKFYGLKKYGEPEKTDVNKGLKTKFKFNGELKDYQHDIVNTVLPVIKKTGGGLISIGCGRGKTVLAIYLASVLKVKTLVIVHQSFLLHQWKERIEQFTDAKIGILQQKKIDVEDKDIVIGMLQSICKDKYDESIFNDFGLVIFDEAHHAPSKYFSKSLPIIACHKTIALSATPKRNDRLEKILHWYFGDMMYNEEQEGDDSVHVKFYEYNSEDPKFKESIHPYTKKPISARNITRMTEITERNRFIINLLKDIVTDKRRNILILSDRLNHLEILKDKLDKKSICTTGYYVGGMKQAKLKESEGKQVLFATYSMASEGLDIKSLNCVILVTPRTNVKQATGRILRTKHEISPLIIDIVDNLKSFVNQGYQRRKYYRKSQYNISYSTVKDNKIIECKDITGVRNTNKKEEIIEDDGEADFVEDSDE